MKKRKRTYRLSAVFWREGDQIVAKCAELGVSSFGRNLEQAKLRLEEAVDLYVVNAKALGMVKDLEAALSSKERFTTIIEVPA
jgi:predicted RNase H-like HicB family nuclease